MQGRSDEPLEQRLDRWITRGRDFVDGVSGARPGSRSPARPGGREPDGRPGWRGEFDGLGRWVEDRLDWLLEEEGDWKEPWQEPGRAGRFERSSSAAAGPAAPLTSRAGSRATPRRRLEAMSRRPAASSFAPASSAAANAASLADRSAPPAATRAPSAAGAREADPEEAWPDDALFQVSRWSRPAAGRPALAEADLTRQGSDRPGDTAAGSDPARPAARRALPRSSRRRAL